MVKCTYAGCGQQFRSQVSLRYHCRSEHSANNPWQCDKPACTLRFATRQQLSAHVQQQHSTAPSDMDKVARLNDVQDNMDTMENMDVDEEAKVQVKEEDKEEISQFVSNAEYFAEQLRIARSAEITAWSGGDFQNAHQWALYVRDQMKDLLEGGANDDAVKMALREKNVNARTIQSAENFLFDSVLGCDALTESMLEPLCASVSKSDNDNMEVDAGKSKPDLDALSTAVCKAISRKSVLTGLADVLTPLGVSTENVMADAAAQVFLDVHRKRPRAEIAKHMRVVAGAAGGTELLLREALLDKETDDAIGIGMMAIATVNAAAEKEPGNAFAGLAPELMARACCLSFALYDKYVSYLLGIAENNKTAKQVDDRLRHLVLCPGQVGNLTRSLIDHMARKRKSNT